MNVTYLLELTAEEMVALNRLLVLRDIAPPTPADEGHLESTRQKLETLLEGR